MRTVIKNTVLVTALALFTITALTAQQPPTPEEQAALMAKYQELAQPGPEHQLLADLVGKWKYSIKMWMSPQMDSPMLAEGIGESKMIIGGRFLESNSIGSIMGQTIETLSIMGFDRRSGEFTSVGFDNTGTYFVTAKGAKNAETGEIVMLGTDYDPIMDFTQEYKLIYKINSKDNYSMSLVFTDPVMSQGTGEFKMVEIDFNRIK